MHLANYILNVMKVIREREGNSRIVVAIAGAGCLGKTTFAKALQEHIGEDMCEVVGLDGYMLSRRRRQSLGNLTGYNPLGFDLSAARKELASLIHGGKKFVLRQYNRATHRRDSPEVIVPKDVIFIEGCLAMTSDLFDLADIHVFVDSDEDTQLELRLRREQREFGYTVAQVSERFDRYLRDYRQYIAPQKVDADVVIQVDSSYNMSFVRIC